MSEVEEVLITGTSLKAQVRAVHWTRQRKPDVYLIPFPSNRWQYSLLALTSGAKKKLLHSYPVGYISALGFIGRRMPAQRGIHDVIQNLRLLKLLGIEPDETESPKFPVNDADRSRAAQMLAAIGLFLSPPGKDEGGRMKDESQTLPSSSFILHPSSLDSPPNHNPLPEYRARGHGDGGYVAVHAGSGSYTVIARAKRWSPEKYAQLVLAMRREFEKPVLILQGPDESGVADSIMRHIPTPSPGSSIPGIHVLKLTGPIGETAAVLEQASLYVGSDSGLAHLAAAVGKRAVTIFAPADPDRICPYGNRDLVVQAEKSCSPCFTYPYKTPYTSSKCREPFCIDTVTVDRVLAAVRRALSPVHPLPVASIPAGQ